MIILKDISINVEKHSSELLVIGYFNNEDITKTASYLVEEDLSKISEASKVELGKNKKDKNIFIYGAGSFKRILFYCLGDKDKITNDKFRGHGSKLFNFAAFSAGMPNESQPMGCNTLNPCIVLYRAITSPIV